ncbi:MAG: ATP synthase F0 subunit B [Proteobacteria bacterium]|nr:ATP synthase F0 subunit B [Pseudomonadota bacterium]
MELIENIALITVNATMVFQVLSFLIFLFIINRIMFRPLQAVMKDRSQYIEDLKQKVVYSKRETEELLVQLKERELMAKEEALQFQKELEIAGSKEAADLQKETQNEISKHTEIAEKEVHLQIVEAKKHLKEESESIAYAIMEKVLNRRLS